MTSQNVNGGECLDGELHKKNRPHRSSCESERLELYKETIPDSKGFHQSSINKMNLTEELSDAQAKITPFRRKAWNA